MDNEKRVLLAIVLSIAVLFIYQAYFTPPPPERAPEGFPTQQSPQQKDTAVPPSRISPPSSMPATIIKTLPQSTADLPATSEKQVIVSTNLFSAAFTSNSARLKSFKLHNYKDKIERPAITKLINKIFSADRDDQPPESTQDLKELIPSRPTRVLPLRTGFIDTAGSVSIDTGWQPDKDALLLNDSPATDSPLTFNRTASNGLAMQKKLLFTQKDYKFNLELKLINKSDTPHEGNAFIEWTAPYTSKNGGGFFGGAATADVARFTYFINGEVENKELKDVGDEIILEGDILWTAIEEKYFISAIVPQNNKPMQIRLAKTDETTVSYQIFFPFISLKPGEEKTYSFFLYLGPRDIDILMQQGSRLEKIINFGYFDIIAKPLLLSLKFFYKFLGNYGLAIILITIIVKIIFWPLTQKSFKSMKGMQSIQPEIAQLKEKYKDNKEEFAKQQMSLYKKYKVNPLGGCLPMLLQIPVFIALYRVLGDSIELRHANFISFWINDLSAKDPTYVAPILMGLSMLFQQKMTPSSADPAQAKMMMFMPIIFTVMFLSFPSGLVIYWLVNNVLSIVQQLYINKKSNVAGGTECSPSKSKPKPKQSKKRSQKHAKN